MTQKIQRSSWKIGDAGPVGSGDSRRPTKDEVISAYIDTCGRTVWTALWTGTVWLHELKSFQATSPEELEDGLNYMASRYVAALDKLERNYSGEELTAQRAKLEEVYQTGKSGMIDGYTRLLQDNLGLSNSDAQAVRDSLSAILAEKEEAYRGALKTGTLRLWSRPAPTACG